MNTFLRFAKVFGISWAVLTLAYAVVIFRGGFAVGWRGSSPPPMWLLRAIFYLWPAVPAFLIAIAVELARAFRRLRT